MSDPSPLAHKPPARKTGTEPFHQAGSVLPVTLQSFWQWSASDLVANTLRGQLAEFIIAHALGIDHGLRTEWDAFDLLTPAGLKIEVKSAAYLQSWHQTLPSKISFGHRKTRALDPKTNRYASEPTRAAQLYIFALLAHRTSKNTLDALDLDQWEFYLVPTRDLDARTRSQHSITLPSLEALCPVATRFRELPAAVHLFEAELLNQT